MFSALLAFNCIYFSSDNNSMFARQQKEENLSKYKSMNSPQERKRQNLPHYLGSERKEKKKKIRSASLQLCFSIQGHTWTGKNFSDYKPLAKRKSCCLKKQTMSLGIPFGYFST